MTFYERISYLYAFCLISVFFLFLPLGGYERMMEGKYTCFLLLSLTYIFAMTAVGAWKELRQPGGEEIAALAFFALTAVSAALSPYGAAVLLGGTRRDGLLTAAVYTVCFLLLSRYLRADRRLVYAAAVSAALCSVLTLVQLAGGNPLGLYPDGLNYYDGDAAYAGFYAGTAGNIDFTAFVLALAAAAMGAALARGWTKRLFAPLTLTLWTLLRLRVAAAWVGLAAAAVLSLPLLFPQRKKRMCLVSALTVLLALGFLALYRGGNRTLLELSALLHGEWEDGFGSGRLGIWRSLLPLAAERPLLGGGCGTLYLRPVEPFYWYRGGETIHVAVTSAHNLYLGILVDRGIPALAAFLALSALALRRAARSAGTDCGAICGAVLLCFLAQAFFSVSTCITDAYLWLLLALLARRSDDAPVQTENRRS